MEEEHITDGAVCEGRAEDWDIVHRTPALPSDQRQSVARPADTSFGGFDEIPPISKAAIMPRAKVEGGKCFCLGARCTLVH